MAGGRATRSRGRRPRSGHLGRRRTRRPRRPPGARRSCPVPPVPKTAMLPSTSGRNATTGCCWRSGSSATPKTIVSSVRSVGSASRRYRSASSGSHGRRGAGMTSCVAARSIMWTTRSMSVGPAAGSIDAMAGTPNRSRFARPEPQRRNLDGRVHRSAGVVTARVRRLERRHTAGAALHDRPARHVGVEEGGLARADHVVGVSLVGHPQCDAQVGVGPQVVLDHAGGPLGGEHEVESERPPALGDVDDAVDELRHLGDERGELVDDDHEARRAVRVVASLQLAGDPWPAGRGAAARGDGARRRAMPGRGARGAGSGR